MFLYFTNDFLVLSFLSDALIIRQRVHDLNVDYFVNIVDEKFPMAKNLVNFGQANTVLS